MLLCYTRFSFKSLQQAKEPPQWFSRLVNDTFPIAALHAQARVAMSG